MKPILLGMCDTRPVSLRRGGPLYPNPGTSGQRLLQVICSVRPHTTVAEFCQTFDRRNVLDAQRWDWREAENRGSKLREEFAGCVVICLGEEVRKALDLQVVIGFGPYFDGKAFYYFLPHPSGRNLWYNEPRNRELVGRLLAGFFPAV